VAAADKTRTSEHIEQMNVRDTIWHIANQQSDCLSALDGTAADRATRNRLASVTTRVRRALPPPLLH